VGALAAAAKVLPADGGRSAQYCFLIKRPEDPSRQGRIETSPAIYRWVTCLEVKFSAVGTVEISHPSGTKIHGWPSGNSVGRSAGHPKGGLEASYNSAPRPIFL